MSITLDKVRKKHKFEDNEYGDEIWDGENFSFEKDVEILTEH